MAFIPLQHPGTTFVFSLTALVEIISEPLGVMTFTVTSFIDGTNFGKSPLLGCLTCIKDPIILGYMYYLVYLDVLSCCINENTSVLVTMKHFELLGVFTDVVSMQFLI